MLPAFAGRILPVTLDVSRHGAALHAPDPRPARDGLIAATALAHGLGVATRNVGDFKGTRVRLTNPWVGVKGEWRSPMTGHAALAGQSSMTPPAGSHGPARGSTAHETTAPSGARHDRAIGIVRRTRAGPSVRRPGPMATWRSPGTRCTGSRGRDASAQGRSAGSRSAPRSRLAARCHRHSTHALTLLRRSRSGGNRRAGSALAVPGVGMASQRGSIWASPLAGSAGRSRRPGAGPLGLSREPARPLPRQRHPARAVRVQRGAALRPGPGRHVRRGSGRPARRRERERRPVPRGRARDPGRPGPPDRSR